MSQFAGYLVKCGCTGASPSMKRWVEISSGQISYYVDESKSLFKGSCVFDSQTRSHLWPNIGSHMNCMVLFTEDSELFFSASDSATRDAFVSAVQSALASLVTAGAVVVSKEFSLSGSGFTDDERLRQHLYSEAGIPVDWLKNNELIGKNKPRTRFADHSWGCIPPYALYKAFQRMYSLYSRLENHTWETLYVSTFN